jgi:hypothetical protein
MMTKNFAPRERERRLGMDGIVEAKVLMITFSLIVYFALQSWWAHAAR